MNVQRVAGLACRVFAAVHYPPLAKVKDKKNCQITIKTPHATRLVVMGCTLFFFSC